MPRMTAGEFFAKPPSSDERKSNLDSQKTWLAPHKVHTALLNELGIHNMTINMKNKVDSI